MFELKNPNTPINVKNRETLCCFAINILLFFTSLKSYSVFSGVFQHPPESDAEMLGSKEMTTLLCKYGVHCVCTCKSQKAHTPQLCILMSIHFDSFATVGSNDTVLHGSHVDCAGFCYIGNYISLSDFQH